MPVHGWKMIDGVSISIFYYAKTTIPITKARLVYPVCGINEACTASLGRSKALLPSAQTKGKVRRASTSTSINRKLPALSRPRLKVGQGKVRGLNFFQRQLSLRLKVRSGDLNFYFQKDSCSTGPGKGQDQEPYLLVLSWLRLKSRQWCCLPSLGALPFNMSQLLTN